jgi:hypothetical protein
MSAASIVARVISSTFASNFGLRFFASFFFFVIDRAAGY